MKYYFAEFKEADENIEVEFPDLMGCVTFGSSFEEAYENAVDVLAGWLANAEDQFIKPPSTKEDLASVKGELTPIPIDEKILQRYEVSKRFNVTFPASYLNKVDEYRKVNGLKRSTLLLKAVEEYLENHAVEA